MDLAQSVLAVGSGGIVGFVLGLIGGGGSIMAVPLLIYVVGLRDVHLAIGTSAVAVAASAFVNLTAYARAKTVDWPAASAFAAAGIAGAAAGARLGQAVDGDRLLALFGAIMVIVGLWSLKPRTDAPAKGGRGMLTRLLPRLIGFGLVVGAASGFFGIGGGFLIVPGLIAATGMPLILAIGSSLVSVTAFGLTTATSYALAGLVDWPIAACFVLGGLGGGMLGIALARRLSASKRILSFVFAGIVTAVGVVMMAQVLTR